MYRCNRLPCSHQQGSLLLLLLLVVLLPERPQACWLCLPCHCLRSEVHGLAGIQMLHQGCWKEQPGIEQHLPDQVSLARDILPQNHDGQLPATLQKHHFLVRQDLQLKLIVRLPCKHAAGFKGSRLECLSGGGQRQALLVELDKTEGTKSSREICARMVHWRIAGCCWSNDFWLEAYAHLP